MASLGSTLELEVQAPIAICEISHNLSVISITHLPHPGLGLMSLVRDSGTSKLETCPSDLPASCHMARLWPPFITMLLCNQPAFFLFFLPCRIKAKPSIFQHWCSVFKAKLLIFKSPFYSPLRHQTLRLIFLL